MHQQVLRRVGIPMYSRERITTSRACRVAAGFLLAILIAGPATAATFVVDTTSDVILNACSVAAADCTLRGAIDAANTLSGADVIEFAIPASDPGCDADGICRIEVVSTLSISHALSINGYTQAGAQPNSIPAPGANNAQLKIEITSVNFSDFNNALFSVGSNVDPFSLRGLAISLPASSIVSGGFRHDHRGNWFCVDARGQSPEFSTRCNVFALGGIMRAIQIGGPNPADRNVIAGGGRDLNGVPGGGFSDLRVNSSAGERGAILLQGNLIGLAPDGVTALPLRDPINVNAGDDAFDTPDIRILDNRFARAQRNFSGGFGGALSLSVSRTMNEPAVIQGNVFGLGVDGSVIGVEKDHIQVFLGNSSRVPRLLIGGLGVGEGNTFAGAMRQSFTGLSLGSAVILPSGTVSTFVEFVGNRMLGNQGIGLDFPTATAGGGTAIGRTPNDAGDPDLGANLQQNHPKISAFSVNGSQFHVTYRVDSNPANSSYPLRVDFYKALGDEGEVLLDSDVYGLASAQQDRSASLTIPPGVSLSDDDVIVAIATDAEGRSSEFSFDTLSLSVVDTPDPHPAGLPFEVTVTAVATSGPFKPNGIVEVSMNTSPATTCQIVLVPSSTPLTSTGSCQMVPVVTGSNRTLTATYLSLQGAFASATGGDITATTTHTVTDPGPEQIGFRSCRFSALEGSDAVIQIERPSGGVASVSVELAHSTGTASVDADYTAPANQVLQWAPGDLAAKTITVPIFSDALGESNEHFRLNLNNVIGAAILPFAQMDVQILDGSEARTFRDGFEGEACLP
ncbi:MAG TPA: Calx-beta domain-containing protein [Aquimonas sp.]|nr:Calx-beta domain-containing protein [Aquimonas sp.]